jgi:hypothetical protein
MTRAKRKRTHDADEKERGPMRQTKKKIGNEAGEKERGPIR